MDNIIGICQINTLIHLFAYYKQYPHNQSINFDPSELFVF